MQSEYERNFQPYMRAGEKPSKVALKGIRLMQVGQLVRSGYVGKTSRAAQGKIVYAVGLVADRAATLQ